MAVKLVTVIIVLSLVGGGTAATVATAGNVDWDEWLTFGNHQIDEKRNHFGEKYTVIHTDPEYNSEDGLYYAVVKCEYPEKEKGILVCLRTWGIITEETENGLKITGEYRKDLYASILVHDYQSKRLTMNTYPININDKTHPYFMELCEKYNLEPEGTFFDVREYGSNPATLYANGKEIDSNFHYKMITVTDDVYILSENNKIELQLIDSSVEGLLNQINDAEGCFNCGAQQGKIRVVIVV